MSEQYTVRPRRVPFKTDVFVLARLAFISGCKHNLSFVEPCHTSSFELKNQLIVEQKIFVQVEVDSCDYRTETAINPIVQIAHQNDAVVILLHRLDLVYLLFLPNQFADHDIQV